MGENMKNKNAKIVSASSRAVFFLAFFLLLLLTVSCFLYSTFVDKENEYLERVTIESGNVGVSLLFVTALFVILFFITKLVRKLQFKRLILLFGLYALTSGIIFVFMARSYPTNDSYAVTAAGAGLARGDTGELIRHTDYFTRYPFQLGYVLWPEIFSFLTGTPLSLRKRRSTVGMRPVFDPLSAGDFLFGLFVREHPVALLCGLERVFLFPLSQKRQKDVRRFVRALFARRSVAQAEHADRVRRFDDRLRSAYNKRKEMA